MDFLFDNMAIPEKSILADMRISLIMQGQYGNLDVFEGQNYDFVVGAKRS